MDTSTKKTTFELKDQDYTTDEKKCVTSTTTSETDASTNKILMIFKFQNTKNLQKKLGVLCKSFEFEE